MEATNDAIRLACERAVLLFGDRGDGLFNAAGFSNAITELAGTNGVLDGAVVRVVLAGRQDVRPMPGGCHYKLLT